MITNTLHDEIIVTYVGCLEINFSRGDGFDQVVPVKIRCGPPTWTPPTSTTTLAKGMGSLVCLSTIFPLRIPHPVCENTNTFAVSTIPIANSKFLNIPYDFMLDYIAFKKVVKVIIN